MNYQIPFLESLYHIILFGSETEVFSILEECGQLVGNISGHFVAPVSVVNCEVGGLVTVVEDGIVIVLLRHPPSLHRRSAHLE